MRRLFHMMSLSLLGSAAWADEPEPQVEVREDGSVVGRMLIEEAPEDVKDALMPAQTQGRPPTGVISVDTTTNGRCIDIHRRTKGLMSPLEMDTRLCPTGTGWQEHLVSSDDFAKYNTTWHVRQAPGGHSYVEVRVDSAVNLKVPESLKHRTTAQGIRDVFTKLMDQLSRR